MDSKIDRCAKSRKTAALKDKRRTIIRLIILVLIPLSLFLCPSCKENKWIDWKTQNELWLAHNKTQPGVEVTSTGLQYKIIADPCANIGESRPNTTSTIICDYELRLINGYVVQSAKAASLSLSNTVPGFSEGCHKIHNQGDIELYIPAYLGYDNEKYVANKYSEAEGYGTEGTTGYIPPYSTLIFKVHICGITGN